MSFKSRMCYVVMRKTQEDIIPVAVFYDEETASGNAEGYNLEFKDRGIEGINFYVACTASYE